MASAKATIRRVTIRVPDADVTATVVRGVGFRFVCDCGAQGSRRPSWALAQLDKIEHLLCSHGQDGRSGRG